MDIATPRTCQTKPKNSGELLGLRQLDKTLFHNSLHFTIKEKILVNLYLGFTSFENKEINTY